MEGRTHMDFGMGEPMDGGMSCTTTVRSVEAGVVELVSVGCVVGLANTDMLGAPTSEMPERIERYDALGRSVPEPHQRLGNPTLVTFPEAPIRVGEHWTAPPALALAGENPMFPDELEYLLEEASGGRAVISAHSSRSTTDSVLATIDVRGVVDLATGVFLSYEMAFGASDLADPSQGGVSIGFEMVVTPVL